MLNDCVLRSVEEDLQWRAVNIETSDNEWISFSQNYRMLKRFDDFILRDPPRRPRLLPCSPPRWCWTSWMPSRTRLVGERTQRLWVREMLFRAYFTSSMLILILSYQWWNGPKLESLKKESHKCPSKACGCTDFFFMETHWRIHSFAEERAQNSNG